jgi:hypothetical protein
MQKQEQLIARRRGGHSAWGNDPNLDPQTHRVIRKQQVTASPVDVGRPTTLVRQSKKSRLTGSTDSRPNSSHSALTASGTSARGTLRQTSPSIDPLDDDALSQLSSSSEGSQGAVAAVATRARPHHHHHYHHHQDPHQRATSTRESKQEVRYDVRNGRSRDPSPSSVDLYQRPGSSKASASPTPRVPRLASSSSPRVASSPSREGSYGSTQKETAAKQKTQTHRSSAAPLARSGVSSSERNRGPAPPSHVLETTESMMEQAILRLEALYFDEYQQQVTLQDLPEIVVSLGLWEGTTGRLGRGAGAKKSGARSLSPGEEGLLLERERKEKEEEEKLRFFCDDIWFQMVRGVPSPYVDFPSFSRVLRQLQEEQARQRRVISRSPPRTRAAPASAVAKKDKLEGSRRSSNDGRVGVRASSPQQSIRSAGSSSNRNRAPNSPPGYSAAAASRNSRAPSPAFSQSSQRSSPRGTFELAVQRPSNPKPDEMVRLVEELKAPLAPARGNSSTRTARKPSPSPRFAQPTLSSGTKALPPQRANSADADGLATETQRRQDQRLSKKAETVSKRLYETRIGAPEPEAVSAKEETSKKEASECTFRPKIHESPLAVSKTGKKGSSDQSSDADEGGENESSDFLQRYRKMTEAWANRVNDSHVTTEAMGSVCEKVSGSVVAHDYVTTDCTFRPAVHSGYHEPLHPPPANGYLETVQRMRRVAADPERYRRNLQDSLRPSDAEAAAESMRYLLKKPLTAVPVTEDEEVVISPTRTDPRAIAAAFCNEKGIPLSDPHRCEVERTVRYVIEQSLIPQYRTLADKGRPLYSSRLQQKLKQSASGH